MEGDGHFRDAELQGSADDRVYTIQEYRSHNISQM